MPDLLTEDLRRQVEKVKKLHEIDIKSKNIEAPLPYALRRKYPNAGKEIAWQYVFSCKKFNL